LKRSLHEVIRAVKDWIDPPDNLDAVSQFR